MQRANHVAAHAAFRVVQVASSFKHHGLTVAANIRDQLYTLWGVHQGTPLVFMGKRMKIAHLGHGKRMADITRTTLEKLLNFTLVQRVIEIARNWKLARGLLQLKT